MDEQEREALEDAALEEAALTDELAALEAEAEVQGSVEPYDYAADLDDEDEFDEDPFAEEEPCDAGPLGELSSENHVVEAVADDTATSTEESAQEDSHEESVDDPRDSTGTATAVRSFRPRLPAPNALRPGPPIRTQPAVNTDTDGDGQENIAGATAADVGAGVFFGTHFELAFGQVDVHRHIRHEQAMRDGRQDLSIFVGADGAIMLEELKNRYQRPPENEPHDEVTEMIKTAIETESTRETEKENVEMDQDVAVVDNVDEQVATLPAHDADSVVAVDEQVVAPEPTPEPMPEPAPKVERVEIVDGLVGETITPIDQAIRSFMQLNGIEHSVVLRRLGLMTQVAHNKELDEVYAKALAEGESHAQQQHELEAENERLKKEVDALAAELSAALMGEGGGDD